ncbi:MAG: murein biosynthesis integral membrane protein MurJ [Pirellulales bacterium]
MSVDDHRKLLAGVRITGLWTLLSRVLGMLRDMATAALLGAGGGAAADAFVVAFRIPNLFRRLFGEGALAASYLPIFSAQWEQDRAAAWRLASVVLGVLSGLMLMLVAAGELLLWLTSLVFSGDEDLRLLLGLTAVMLPYVLCICVTAQLSATLHALGRFALPAIVPTVLNLVWLGGAWLVAPRFSDDQATQAYILAFCVLIGGALQLLLQVPTLWRLGFRFQFDWSGAREGLMRVVRNMLPMMFGLAIEQINTLLDSMIAWALAGSGPIGWLGGATYPMEQGAAAALYYASRLYQFPLGMLGVAVATVFFPLLARHAGRGELHRIGPDLSLGLQLVIFLAVPASVGLMLLSLPITELIFQRGVFTAEDSQRTAALIATFGGGVWALCALPVVIRGFYAVGDRRTPLVAGSVAVAVNLLLNLLLVWPLAEVGLAAATVVAAVVQLLILLVVMSRLHALNWRGLAGTTARAVAASAVMAVACWAVLLLTPSDIAGARAVRVVAPAVVGGIAYLVAYRLLGGREFALLWSRGDDRP